MRNITNRPRPNKTKIGIIGGLFNIILGKDLGISFRIFKIGK